MKSKRIKFQNTNGEELNGFIEFPADQHPNQFAVFAHCFTCSKDLNAVRNIARALTVHGFAVARFDFTGLGQSKGEFADTNFTSNIDDLHRAVTALGEQYQPPSLLIGHSLGGAAALAAAGDMSFIQAVVTIGAPFEPSHVTHLFGDAIAELESNGEAEANIGGRPFKIKKQLVDDLNQQCNAEKISKLKKALLVMHSPQDMIVNISNASQIYQAAKHPKSFVSLDGADHLLSNKTDSVYVGNLIAGWVQRYVDMPQETPLTTDQQVVARIDDDPGFTTELQAGRHGMIADEPERVGGNDFGPTPYDYLISGLGACTVMTLKMYATRKKWPLREAKVHLSHDKIHADDCDCDFEGGKDGRIDRITRIVELEGELDHEQKQRLMEIADRCPVHRTLEGDILITTKLSE